eukprot:CAMPEP_0183759960 /NCGR_PEP_ID=MMETSP0739-20130205/7428_1 /TAXON_ID=385413 /ORGANISM="Thalassiosira miniscula, Strain CCMP1093" /LENGTH=903 /DNA_ID=CAMNT_0025997831 /DNA_START=469 /DNA_END=3180 /DNA_ORIENTATION=+
MTVLEEAARLREKDNEILSIHNSDTSSLATASPANSIALFNGTNKRSFASKSTTTRSYRTGRWASEESTYTDKLIKSFDAGLLPLPHGIKLNDFLCELLSCRTSRLTKKLKNAKLSARTYRSWASGNTTGSVYSTNQVGGDIQRTQTLFLKAITPEWVRMELQFNISRMWRTHLANFCLQISYLQLNTKEWFASLDAVDYIAMSCNDTKQEARKKRMRSALTEDVNAAARTSQPLTKDRTVSNDNEAVSEISCTSSEKEGVFVGGFPFQRLSSLNLKSLGEEEEKSATLRVNADADPQYRERTDSLSGSIPKESSAKLSSMRKFSFEASVLEQSMKHSTSLSSFVELFTPELRPTKPPSRRSSSIDISAFPNNNTENGKNEEFEVSSNKPQQDSEVDNIIDEAIDSVLESSSVEKECQGLFLKEICKFLTESDSPFQHVDIWVPMDVSHSEIVGKKHIGGSSTFATTSSPGVTGIIYGQGQPESAVRLSNAGYITARTVPQIMNQLNEFGMYSKNFSFSPGFGMPGRVFLSRIPSWENNLSLLKPEQFARVGGAKIYGVNTALCLPIFTPIGTMVVSLYSTQNLSRDLAWEKKCMEYFWKLKPEPKWKLTIDVGLKTSADDSQDVPPSQAPRYSPRITSTKSQAYVIPPSPTISKSTQQPKSSSSSTLNFPSKVPLEDKNNMTPATPQCNQQSLALLLGKYMPLDRESSSNGIPGHQMNNHDVASNLMALRLLLLRHSSYRSDAESKMIEVIMGKYRNYLAVGMKEHDVILSIVNEWKRLSVASSTANVTQSRTSVYDPKRVNYGGQTSNFGTPNYSVLSQSNSCGGIQTRQPPPIPSMNTFEDNFSLPLAVFGSNSLQNMASVASSMAELNGPHHQYDDQNNVPRVVSEQGPIEQNSTSMAT